MSSTLRHSYADTARWEYERLLREYTALTGFPPSAETVRYLRQLAEEYAEEWADFDNQLEWKSNG